MDVVGGGGGGGGVGPSRYAIYTQSTGTGHPLSISQSKRVVINKHKPVYCQLVT